MKANRILSGPGHKNVIFPVRQGGLSTHSVPFRDPHFVDRTCTHFSTDPMISDELADALNDQIQTELEASAMYLGMGAYLRSEDWNGFALFVEEQSQEERDHAMRIYDFLDEVGKEILVPAVGKPRTDFDSVEEVFEDALEAEKNNTASFHELQEIANRNNDNAVNSLLQWFHDEQVEEENHIEEVLVPLRRMDADDKYIYVLDKDLEEELVDENGDE